jgi:predicted negative regulator of RcsB-dependent stress response
MLLLLAEETIFQQQERTLWSIEGTLTAVAVMLALLVLVAFVIASRLGRANRIARASYDLLKEAAEARKAKKDPAAAAPLQEEKKVTPPKAEPLVYKI